MSIFTSHGYNFGDLWSKVIDGFHLDPEEMITILKEISPEQFMVLYNSQPSSGIALENLLVEYYIITYPERAAKLFERMAKRNNAAGKIADMIADHREYIKRREQKELEKNFKLTI